MTDILRLAKEIQKQRLKTREQPSAEQLFLLAEALQRLAAAALEHRDFTIAVSAADESRLIYRELAEKNPGAFLPNLAMSLNNVGTMLSELGRREEALAATEESVYIRRKLADKNPGAFLPDLAGSLGSLGSVLRGMERHKEAAESFTEGLQLLLPLLRKLPEAFSALGAGLLQEYLSSVEAAGLEPDEELARSVRKVLAAHTSSKTLDFLNSLFRMTEEAA